MSPSYIGFSLIAYSLVLTCHTFVLHFAQVTIPKLSVNSAADIKLQIAQMQLQLQFQANAMATEFKAEVKAALTGGFVRVLCVYVYVNVFASVFQRGFMCELYACVKIRACVCVHVRVRDFVKEL